MNQTQGVVHGVLKSKTEFGHILTELGQKTLVNQ